jgi:hypothetical protein
MHAGFAAAPVTTSISTASTGRMMRVAFILLCVGCARPLMPERLAGAPPDLVARSSELLQVVCPPGAQVVEHATRGHLVFSIHRHCERPRDVLARSASGFRDGPYVTAWTNGTSSTLERGGSLASKQHGLFVTIDDRYATEVEWTSGQRRGPFRQRDLVTGVTVIEGAFDDHGLMHGTWTVRHRDGTLAREMTMEHGTGVIEVWNPPPEGSCPGVLSARTSCKDGRWDGWQKLDVGGPATVVAEFHDGVPDGPWRESTTHVVNAEGTYARGIPVGTWHGVTTICLVYSALGDAPGCVSTQQDVPYHCEFRHADRSEDRCTIDPDARHGGESVAGPRYQTAPRLCEVPREP